jgi:hypothetical protein
VENEVIAEAHSGANGEDDPGRGEIGDEAGVDANVLEKAHGVELLLRAPLQSCVMERRVVALMVPAPEHDGIVGEVYRGRER